jgi:hypothetical protein
MRLARAHFSLPQRAALDCVTELIKNKMVNPDTFARMANYYSECKICEILWLVASEQFYKMCNMSNIGPNIHSDMFYDNRKK